MVSVASLYPGIIVSDTQYDGRTKNCFPVRRGCWESGTNCCFPSLPDALRLPISQVKSLSQKACELEERRIMKKAIDIFGSRQIATEWMNTPLVALNNQTPREVMKTSEGAKWVSNVLEFIKSGECS